MRPLLRGHFHQAMFFITLGAGTFTPIAVMALTSQSSQTLLITIWSVAAFGFIQSLFFVNMPKYINAIFYLVMGYMILPYLPELTSSIGVLNTRLLIGGGPLYTIGAVCYAAKRPVLNPMIFSYHEIFHLFVNIAAAVHFAVIYSLI